MAIDKPSLNDFLPNGFETQDKDGYKVNFDADKISAGYDKDTLEILSGPNLNNLLDNVGKNTHTLQQFLNFFRDMPIGSFPVVNTSNQLDYKSVNSFFRNVGEIVFSAIPLEDGNLRLLDGSLLEYTMTYSRFITYIAGYRTSLPNLFCTQAEFDQSVATYGVCGKFVYDTVTKSLRLPKISGFIKGTLDSGSLGDIDEAKAPNITGTFCADNTQVGNSQEGGSHAPTGAFYKEATIRNFDLKSDNSSQNGGTMGFDASRSSSVYKNGATTIEPQAVKEFIYMVVSIDEAEKQVLSAVYNYKGSVENYSDLPTAVAIGEVYNVIGEDPEGYSGANFAWTGEEWDRLGGTVNLSGYLTKVEGANTYATKASLESNVDYLQGQINTNASNIANIASQEVIDAGIRKIEMLKFASTLGAGKVTDTDLFEVIKGYKYSSFDRSKFTVVGSPNITDDGIASGFSSGNYLKTNTSISVDKDFVLSFEYTVTASFLTKYNSSQQYLIGGTYNPLNDIIPIIFEHTSSAYKIVKFTIILDNNGTNLSIPFNSSQFDIALGDVIRAELSRKNGTYTAKYYKNGVQIGNDVVGSSTNNLVFESNLIIGQYKTNWAYEAFTGSTDLKQFSITVDGVEVFSGHKTGIDTIKPDNYTVVGTPTISADGIASGFSTTKYITANVSIDFTKIWKVQGEFTTGDTISAQNIVSLDGQISPVYYLVITGTGQLSFRFNNGVTINTNFALSPNKIYSYEVEWDKEKLYLRIGFKGSSLTEFKLDTTTGLVLSSSSSILIGTTNFFPFLGSIDLNAFKIYVDGNLVYQPCLKIPYTESKTGLKITDKLDRAIDMAEQCGFSQYFGLDEQNMLCLVPQGENITGRRDLISRIEDSVTHYVTEIYSDLYCKQMGSGTASTAVTLNIPYKDEYYKLSVPQSAKSKTGFTPTASCDWTAEGYIYLDEVI